MGPKTPTSRSEFFSLAHLTPAERAVAVDVARGYTLEEIARRKIMSYPTVKNKLALIYSKLGMEGHNSRTILASMVWKEAQSDPHLALEIRRDMGV